MSRFRQTLLLVAPYAAWMALMGLLPPTPGAYAVRTAATAGLLAAAFVLSGRRVRRPSAEDLRAAASGLALGLAVFALWILPEQFDWPLYRRFGIVGEGGTRAVASCGAGLLAVRLCGSAFVISVAEELFFRRWLIGFAGFWGSVFLFAVEHDRWLVGAVAGVLYGLAYLRRGLVSSVVAHATTNLVLGLWVLATGQWQFW